MRTSLLSSLSALVPFLPGVAVAQQLDPNGPTDTFSRLYPVQVKTFVKSSSDPHDDVSAPSMGNDDGFSGVNATEAYRDREGAEEIAVLAHLEGRSGFMGCFFRNYWTDLAGSPRLPFERNRVQLWIDGIVEHDHTLPEFYRNVNDPLGQVPPFTGPFTGNRSGGHLTHTPLEWKRKFEVRVFENAFDNAARFHKVCGSLDGPDHIVARPVLADWEEIDQSRGQWPHDTQRIASTRTLTLGASGGSDRILLSGPATLLELTCRVQNLADFADLRAVFTWDQMAQPSVDVPLRMLGAMIDPPFTYAQDGLLFRNNGVDEITCYLPMHFAQSGDLTFVNDGATPVQLDVTWAVGTGQHPGPWGYFTAEWSEAITQTGLPFVGPHLTDARGMLRGIFLESTLDTTGRIPAPIKAEHLEGDLMVRINGNRGDDHTFAASETSIGKWGWYGTPADQPFSQDFSFNSGWLVRPIPAGAETKRLQGSLYAFDPVQFVSEFEMLLEHGVLNGSNAEYGLFTFFYVEPGAAREAIDTLDVGDTLDETRLSAVFTGDTRYELTAGFFRDLYFGTPLVTDDVREIDGGSYSFTLPLPTGSGYRSFGLGFRLDRPKLREGGICQVDVLVDGEPAGLLHAWTSNRFARWKEGGELEVELPMRLTTGKSQVRVELRHRSGTEPLRLARVELFGYTRD